MPSKSLSIKDDFDLEMNNNMKKITQNIHFLSPTAKYEQNSKTTTKNP